MDDRIEIYGEGGLTIANLHMGNALPTYSEHGFAYAVEKAPTTTGWTYPVFEELWNYGFPQEDAPLRPRHPGIGGPASDWRRRQGCAGSDLRCLRFRRPGAKGQLALSNDSGASGRRVAEQEKSMSRIPMLDNILAQPASHRGLLTLHQGNATLRACAEKIRTAQGRIILSGMGGSLFATVPTVSRLTQQGYPVQAMESAELLHYGSATLRAGDVGVVVSRSGGSIEPVLVAEKMRQVGMTVIGVTNVPGSDLEQIADITLPIGSRADKLIAVQTYTGTVLALLLLAEEVLAGESATLSDECAATLPALSEHIDECLRESEGWEDWLTGGPLYLLGRGPALASVYEGALLLHETAKTAAVGMSSGQFRHGTG